MTMISWIQCWWHYYVRPRGWFNEFKWWLRRNETISIPDELRRELESMVTELEDAVAKARDAVAAE